MWRFQGHGPHVSECGRGVIVPLVHDGSFVGVVGMGTKTSLEPFGEEDTELLATLVNTVSPLLVNSYLFMEIVNLGS